MLREATKVEQFARTLEYLVRDGFVPGLLPQDVTEAAQLLRDQYEELKTLRTALAAKRHVVAVTAKCENYKIAVRGKFIITDPVVYEAEILVDDRTRYAAADRDWKLHVARTLTRAATDKWLAELTYAALVQASKAIDEVEKEAG